MPGRVDAVSGLSCPKDGLLPDATKGLAHIREIFHRMGFNDRDIVALSGAHVLGKCHAGFVIIFTLRASTRFVDSQTEFCYFDSHTRPQTVLASRVHGRFRQRRSATTTSSCCSLKLGFPRRKM